MINKKFISLNFFIRNIPIKNTTKIYKLLIRSFIGKKKLIKTAKVAEVRIPKIINNKNFSELLIFKFLKNKNRKLPLPINEIVLRKDEITISSI